MRRPSVFVVDDEEQIRSLLARVLVRDGLRVSVFAGAEEALAALGRDPPDVLVTDLRMPGTNGIELAAQARELAPGVSIVVITGYASLENVVDALRSGVDDFVTKPFGAAEFRAVIARVLERRARPAAPPAPREEPPPADDDLARRTRDVETLRSIHGLLSDEFPSRDVLVRAAPLLEAALGTARGVLAAQDVATGAWRSAATLGPSPGRSDAELPSSLLSDVSAAGVVRPLDGGRSAPLAAWTGGGPAAAAPLGVLDRSGEGCGVLVLARPGSARPFDDADLRSLAGAAAALGDVFRSVRAAEQVEEAYTASLLDIVTATESRSPWFRDHSTRVRDVAVALGRRVGLDPEEIAVLDVAARLLDLGRVQIPDGLLDKPGRLSPEEWRAVRDHCEAAERFVRPLGLLRHVQPVVRHHHENWDGTGYPDGLRGEDIPFLASLVRIADAYSALTEARPWREPVAAEAAVHRIVEGAGTRFHPELAAAFAELRLGGERSEP